MPFSQSTQLSIIVGWLEKIRPASVLDVGAGIGVYGLLARVFLDREALFRLEAGRVSYQTPGHWPTRIDGIEGFASYANPLHTMVYDSVRFSEALSALESIPDGYYEVVLAVDLIEHFSRENGLRLLQELQRVASRAALISTPRNFVPQHYDENPLEDHLSLWSEVELATAGFSRLLPNRNTWIAVNYRRGEIATPDLLSVQVGVKAHLAGDLAGAEAAYRQALRSSEETGKLAAMAGVHGAYLLALLAFQQGREEDARRYAECALSHAGISIPPTAPVPQAGTDPLVTSTGAAPPNVALAPTAAPQELFLELTTRCNLRCSYCAVSLPQYHGQDLNQQAVTDAVRYVAAEGIPTVSVNVHGETTQVENWQAICAELIATGAAVNVISNFARRFADDEVITLSGFAGVRISIDSFDRTTLRRLRGADPRIIVDNLLRIRSAALLAGRPPPQIGINCVLSEPSLRTLEGTIAAAAQLNVAHLMVHNCAAIDGLPNRPRVIGEFSGEERREAVAALRKALQLADRLGLHWDMDPSLRMMLTESETGEDGPVVSTARYFITDASVRVLSKLPSAGETRDCLDPWRVMKIAESGNVMACCVGKEVMGNLTRESLENIWRNDAFVTRRQQLLRGELPEECRVCPGRALIKTEHLLRKVEGLET